MSNQWGSLNGERGTGLERVAPSGIGARELTFRLCSSEPYFQKRFEACAGEAGQPITHITCAVDGDSVRSLIDLLELSKVSKGEGKEEKVGGGKAAKGEKRERRRKGSGRSMSVDSS